MEGVGKLRTDPFRLFFPLGLAFGLWAPLTWVSYVFFAAVPYPGQWHADLMFGGFFLCFVTGFLLTALPRFTQTASLSSGGFAGFAALALALFVVAGLRHRPLFFLVAAIMNLGLIGFASRRFFQRRINPPYTFVFVGMGLTLGLAGYLLCGIGEWRGMLTPLGRNLLFHGMVLSLILGAGGRLVPGILGWDQVVAEQKARYENTEPFLTTVPWKIWALAALFLCSFYLEAIDQVTLGRSMRSLVLTTFILHFWRLHRSPPKQTPLTKMLRLAGISMGLGSWLYAAGLRWDVAGAHLLFVSGFLLLTLMIASRVVAAHGEGTAVENRRLPFYLPAGLVGAAAVTRFYAEFAQAGYFSHLGYAALALVLGVLAWGLFFLKRIWRT